MQIVKAVSPSPPVIHLPEREREREKKKIDRRRKNETVRNRRIEQLFQTRDIQVSSIWGGA